MSTRRPLHLAPLPPAPPVLDGAGGPMLPLPPVAPSEFKGSGPLAPLPPAPPAPDHAKVTFTRGEAWDGGDLTEEDPDEQPIVVTKEQKLRGRLPHEILTFVHARWAEGATYGQISIEMEKLYGFKRSPKALAKIRTRSNAERADRRAEQVADAIEGKIKNSDERIELLIQLTQALIPRAKSVQRKLQIVDSVRRLIETQGRLAGKLGETEGPEDNDDYQTLLLEKLDKLVTPPAPSVVDPTPTGGGDPGTP